MERVHLDIGVDAHDVDLGIHVFEVHPASLATVLHQQRERLQIVARVVEPRSEGQVRQHLTAGKRYRRRPDQSRRPGNGRRWSGCAAARRHRTG